MLPNLSPDSNWGCAGHNVSCPVELLPKSFRLRVALKETVDFMLGLV